MAELSDLSRKYQLFLRAYRFRPVEPAWTPLAVPITEARVALVSTAGLITSEHEPFSERVLGGDASYRIVDAGAEVGQMIDCHRSEMFDHRGIAGDANVGFPLDRLRELAAEGAIGEVAPRHLSFMGSITLTGRLRNETAPAAARLLVEDEVDVALLIPV